MIRREDVVLLRLPMLRLRFRRPHWENVRRVRVGIGVHSVLIDIEVVDEPTVHGGHRRWLCCPCGRRTSVLGMSCATGQLGCRRCLNWRSRSPSVMSPQVTHASTGIATHEEVPET